ncbi:MAG: hypothetical protein IJ183_01145 [Prevotella sp.]|nr:hypothetical protein [Prevotella sp.]MBQ9561393.1 hypothetical protein [Prevotella sp.]
MIKKEYVQPEVKEIKIQLSHLMTTSDPTTGTKFDPTEETSDNDGLSLDFDED